MEFPDPLAPTPEIHLLQLPDNPSPKAKPSAVADRTHPHHAGLSAGGAGHWR